MSETKPAAKPAPKPVEPTVKEKVLKAIELDTVLEGVSVEEVVKAFPDATVKQGSAVTVVYINANDAVHLKA